MNLFSLSADELSALYLSAKVALFATAFSLPFAIGLAWVLARYDFKFKVIVEAFLQLPMVLPPVVLGYLLLILFGNQGFIGQYLSAIGFELAFNWKGAVLTSMIVGFPLLVQPIRLAFQLSDRHLEEVAQTLGASFRQIFFKIYLPLAYPGILMGCILGFSRSLGEFGATITFIGNIPDETRTIPIAIYSFLQQPDGEIMAMRLVILSLILAFGALLVNYLVLHKYKNEPNG